MTKLILNITFLALFGIANSQVAIGKTEVDGAGILDFAEDDTRGIILPIVNSLPATPANGTILFNNVSGDVNHLKVMAFENGTWKPLSAAGSISAESKNGEEVTTSYEPNLSEDEGQGVVIGQQTLDTPEGVLVLEAPDKSLILPKVANPHLTIKSPRAGTICYDTETNSMAVFDGKVWTFWK